MNRRDVPETSTRGSLVIWLAVGLAYDLLLAVIAIYLWSAIR